MIRQKCEEFQIDSNEDAELFFKHLRALFYMIQGKPYRIVATISTEEVEQEFPEGGSHAEN